jgi:hypothetical protein
MGILKPFTRSKKPLRPERLPSGAFTLHRGGEIVGSTLPSSFPLIAVTEIGRVVLEALPALTRRISH